MNEAGSGIEHTILSSSVLILLHTHRGEIPKTDDIIRASVLRRRCRTKSRRSVPASTTKTDHHHNRYCAVQCVLENKIVRPPLNDDDDDTAEETIRTMHWPKWTFSRSHGRRRSLVDKYILEARYMAFAV